MDGKTLGNLSVHPMTADDEKNACVDGWGSTGITLRQHFAILCMAGLRATGHPHAPTTSTELASIAVEDADALLAELSKEAQ